MEFSTGTIGLAVGSVLVVQKDLKLLVLSFVMSGFESLALLDWVSGDQATATGLAGEAELVHLLRDSSTLVLERDRVSVLVDGAERLVDLDVLAVRHPLDDAGLDAVLEDCTVTALQADAEPVGHEVRDGRKDDHADTADPRHCVQRDVQVVRDDVVDAGDREHQVERDGHRTDSGTDRHVARALQDVVVSVVSGETLLDPRVRDQQCEDEAHDQGDGEHCRDRVPVEQVDLPRRPQSSKAVRPHHVDIGLGTCRDL